MSSLPYQAKTATGDIFDISFPLHPETGDPVRVAQLITGILAVIDKDMAVLGEASNGDVLQAVAMALAIRSRMIHAPEPVTRDLVAELISKALNAAHQAERRSPQSGNA